MTATILVVDDLEANLKLLEVKLLSEYYTVITATNGMDALKIIDQNKIDLILLDVMMPGIDGFETCKIIKTNPETMHIPVIMVTALCDIEDRVKGLEAGADEFLTKPINDTALFARVKSLTRMKLVIDELKLRNSAVLELGGNTLEVKENFADSKILLLDDDVIQARNIQTCLASLSKNVQILTSPDHIENLSYIPDVIIISCQFDGLDPLRIITMIRAKPNFKNIILTLLTEEDNMAMVIKGMELGINDYFVYPVDKSELQARIKTQLRRKNYQDKLRTDLEKSVDLSTKDSLTGLFNMRYFKIHIKQMRQKTQESGKNTCIMMLDIDYFKSVNDIHGHPIGDMVLKKIANTLKDLFNVTDLIARYGGEEFIILLNNINIENCSIIAEKIRSAIESIEFMVPGQNTPLKKTTSIGVSELAPRESIECCIARVDKALYRAKDQGRNRVVIG